MSTLNSLAHFTATIAPKIAGAGALVHLVQALTSSSANLRGQTAKLLASHSLLPQPLTCPASFQIPSPTTTLWSLRQVPSLRSS